ncbi:MAG: hypothetical protein K2X66_15380, partial [Cyanobacteria bacterium]|nr:hypothetical protein [Cyanobacteriota bacterium]
MGQFYPASYPGANSFPPYPGVNPSGVNAVGYPGASYSVGGPGGNPQGIAVNGPVDIMIPKPMPGVPASALPPVIVRPSQPALNIGNNFGVPPIPGSGYQIAGVPYAQSFPISNQAPPIPAMPDVPPPTIAAPWLFYSPAKNSIPGGPGGNPNFQNNYYNNYGQGGGAYPPGYYPYPGGPYPNQYPGQYPPNLQPTPPQGAPPVAKQTPETPTPDASKAKAEPPKPDAKEADKKDDLNNFLPKKPNASVLTNEMVNRLNDQLSNDSATVRSNAAMDLFKILEANPDIFQNATYKP